MAKWLSKKNGYRFLLKIQEVCKDDNYDFSRVMETYVNNRTNVCIIDKSINPETGEEYGEFWMTPSNLLKGRKNPKGRGRRISEAKTMTTEDFIKKAIEVHKGEDLDYSRVAYKGAHEKVYIIDHSLRPDGTEYGGYWQEANAHLKGCGHPDKGKIKRGLSRKQTLDQVRKKLEIVLPNNDYIIPDQEYADVNTKIKVICNKHGEFYITPSHLLSGRGCPMCRNTNSANIREIADYLTTYFGEEGVELKKYGVIKSNKGLDIYIPSKKTGIEFNGLKYNSEEFGKDRNYRLNKLEEAKENGVTLIELFEDEFMKHKDIVLSKIGHILGLDLRLPKVMARKCLIEPVRQSVAKQFLDTYHIQGYGSATVNLGCFHEEKLIAVMSFKQESEGMWNLTRFASDTNVVCQGVGGKLFKYFLRNYNPTEVKTFLDRRWEHNVDNNVYIKMGFVVDKYEAPDYMYTDGHGGDREHKFGFRKQVLNRKYGLPLSMTENEMVKELGYFKVWNCGLIKYIWRKQ